jgi:hypothetical protein
LEGADWGEINPDLGRTTLERRVYRLLLTPLCDFSVDDLRVLLGQGLSLDYVMPLAIEALEQDPWCPGDSVPGMLLKVPLAYMDDFWSERPDLWRALGPVLDRAVDVLPELDEFTSSLIKSLPGEYTESELDLVMNVRKDHRKPMLGYLGLDYAPSISSHLGYTGHKRI